MGVWGAELYANDVTCDVRDDYIDKLRQGLTNEDATKELIKSNQELIDDNEDQELFWYALADTQWEYGRLLPYVRDKALLCIKNANGLQRWEDSDMSMALAWEEMLYALKKKLMSEQPKAKRVAKYRVYHCKWDIGDTYAYCFNSEYSKGKGYLGKYVVFRKIANSTWWPGHTIPVVNVYKAIWDLIPTIDALYNIPFLEQGFFPSALSRYPNKRREYAIAFLSTSAKIIPVDRLTFLGNTSYNGSMYASDDMQIAEYVGWEGSGYNNTFERYILEMYSAWKDID